MPKDEVDGVAQLVGGERIGEVTENSGAITVSHGGQDISLVL